MDDRRPRDVDDVRYLGRHRHRDRRRRLVRPDPRAAEPGGGDGQPDGREPPQAIPVALPRHPTILRRRAAESSSGEDRPPAEQGENDRRHVLPRMASPMRTTNEIREGFLSFFEEKGHLRRPSASLVPRSDDRSTLLTTAGMQPQMPYFLGREAPPAPLTTTCQKCFRTPDIDEVGLDGSHLTFFEMLGNFSFGQYFKEGAIQYAAEFVRERLQLDWDRIWVSVFAGDPELGLEADEVAIRHWLDVG